MTSKGSKEQIPPTWYGKTLATSARPRTPISTPPVPVLVCVNKWFTHTSWLVGNPGPRTEPVVATPSIIVVVDARYVS